jgi:hypothetical protein
MGFGELPGELDEMWSQEHERGDIRRVENRNCEPSA